MTRAAVAWVAGEPVDVAEVDVREAGLRGGPTASTLPRVGTSDGRQLRRWLVQVLVAERLVGVAARELGLEVGAAPALGELAPDRAALLGLGSVAADLLARSAVARAVFVAVTADVSVAEETVRDYYVANGTDYLLPERRVVRQMIAESPGAADPDGRPLRTVRRGELGGVVEDVVFGAAAGEVVGPVRDALGWHTVRVVEVLAGRVREFDEVRGEIEARLVAAARRRAFTAWLDRRTAEHVRLAPGFEHPGDPGQPDNTHRH
ncbi:MAG TPA: peptidylprolyl isomerase [Actinophytocola sp.]|nr:peptidylprolyl isomerase [Actinophytocola sp.]